MKEMSAITLDQMNQIRLMDRVDTKFLTNKEELFEVLSYVQNTYFVQEVEHKRIASYRTTYWDDDEHHFYLMHQNGHQPRMKIRVRTYEDSNDLTYLEIKSKDNKGKTHKKRTQVKSQNELLESGGNDFLAQNTGIKLTNLHPCLQNHFKRITLVNNGMTERLTIDFDIEYNNFETNEMADTGNLAVIELKCSGMFFSPISDILTKLHIHRGGYSKYIFGSFMTNSNLKSNLIKPKFVEIKKFI